MSTYRDLDGERSKPEAPATTESCEPQVQREERMHCKCCHCDYVWFEVPKDTIERSNGRLY